MADSSTLYYWSELRFYRFVLGINWRTGRKLIRQGVLVPDAYVGDRALFLANGENIQHYRQEVAAYIHENKSSP